MKLIVLIRHAKSSWKHPELTDMDRPLKKRGLRDAPLIGKILKEVHQFKPDVILCSPAARAYETATLIAGELGVHEEMIVKDSGLYLETASSLLKAIQSIDDRHQTVALVSHNP